MITLIHFSHVRCAQSRLKILVSLSAPAIIRRSERTDSIAYSYCYYITFGDCPMRSNVRAVGQICPARGRRIKLPPRRPHRATFAARPEVSANAHHCKGNRAQRNKPSADADSHPPSTACHLESRQQHQQDCCGGALGYTILSCEPAHLCPGHCNRDQHGTQHYHYHQPCGVCFRLGLRHLFFSNCAKRRYYYRTAGGRIPRQAGRNLRYGTT